MTASKRSKPVFWRDEIWNKREHVCQCCGTPLSEPMRTFYFSHVVSVGRYKMSEFWPENIMLNCLDCHQEWEFGNRQQEKFEGARILSSALVKTISFLSK